MRLALVSSDREVSDTQDLSRALRDLGHDVAVDLAPEDDESRAAPLGHDLHERWLLTPPDAVLAVGTVAGVAVAVAARAVAVPVVQRLVRPERPDDPARARLAGALARESTLVLASGSNDVEALVALGVRRTRVRTVPLGVDTSVFTDARPSPQADGPRVVVRSRPEGLRALLAVLASQRETEMLVLGTPGSGEGWIGLADLAARQGVRARLRLLAVPDRDALAGLLRAADLAVVLEDDDGSLRLAIQAIASGTPVVGADRGSLPDIVVDGVTGRLVNDRSADAAAEAVRSLLSDPVARESFGNGGVDRARVRFAWDVVARDTARVLAEAAELAAAGELVS
jgi:D-inositol-3-phosphate glycosyltransferase